MDCSLLGSCDHGDSPGKNTRVGCRALLVLEYSQLANSVVIVSAEQRRDATKHIHVSIHPQTTIPARLPHTIEQSSLCCTVGPCWLSMYIHVHPKLGNYPLPTSEGLLLVGVCGCVCEVHGGLLQVSPLPPWPRLWPVLHPPLCSENTTPAMLCSVS